MSLLGRGSLVFVLPLALTGLAGCSGAGPRCRAPSRSTRNYHRRGVHQFHPEKEKIEGVTAKGGPRVGGKYTHKLSGAQAPVPGQYKVEISLKRKTGRQVPTPGDPSVMREETVEEIPPRTTPRPS